MGFEGLEVLIFGPDASLKVALAFFQFQRSNVKNVGADFVDLLSTHIFDVIVRQVAGGQNEMRRLLNVIEILLRHGNALEAGRWCLDHLFVALACRSKEDVAGQTVLPIRAVILIEFLENENLRVSEIVALFAKFVFVLRKFLDDLLKRDTWRFTGNMRGRLLPRGVFLR